MSNDTPNDLFKLSVQMTSSYLSNQNASIDEMPVVFSALYQAIAQTHQSPNLIRNRPTHQPAVPISESIQDDYIICLEDGKKLQMLKRHLNVVYKMSLDQYKERWGLPANYPVVSPRYARRRRQIAKSIGLGLSGRLKKKEKTKS